MIKSKEDLEFYLDADKFALNRKTNKPRIHDEIWKFQILLRKTEYYKNIKPTFLSKILLPIYQLRKHRLGIKLGFDIPIQCIWSRIKNKSFWKYCG